MDVSGVLFVGVDLETTDLMVGNLDPGLCVNNDLYNVTVTTTGGPYVSAGTCNGTGCTPVLGPTGLVGAPAPATSIGTTTVCVGICTAVPAPLVDTGYDLYVDGTRVSGVCVSIGTAC